MQARFFPALLAVSSFAGVTVQSVDVTRQQSVVTFVVPDPAQCTVTVYSDAALSAKMDDTNNAVFAGSESCNRASSIVNGSFVTAVLGLRNSGLALDGKLHSRSLAVATTYWVKITDTLNHVSVTKPFATQNIPWGDTHPEVPPFHAAGFGNWGYPDLDWSDAGVGKWYVDPLGGLPFRRLPRNPQTGGGYWGNQPSDILGFGGAFDITKEKTSVAKWTSVSNALNQSVAGPFASYSGAGQDPLFLALDRLGMLFPYNVDVSLDDIQVHLYGNAPGCSGEDCKILVCLATKYNPQTDQCTSPEQEVTLPTSAGQVDVPSAANGYPSYQFGGWNIGRMLGTDESGVWGSKNTGNGKSAVVTSSSVALNLSSNNDTLLPLWAAPGMKINFNSTWYTIGTLGTAASFTLQEPGATATSDWMLANIGVRIRKKTTANNAINIAASFSMVTGGFPEVVTGSSGDWCNRTDFPLSVATDGVTPIPTKRARLCMVGENLNRMMFILADDGEIRYISALGNGPYGGNGYMQKTFGTWVSNDPFSIYVPGTDDTNNSYNAIYKAVYTPSNGCNYKEWPGNNYKSVQPPSDCLVFTNLTPYAKGLSVTQQIAPVLASEPIWDSTFDAKTLCNGTPGASGAVCFHFYSIAGHYAYYTFGMQNGVTFYACFDLNTGLLVKLFDSYSNVVSGMRFEGMHSGGETDGDHMFGIDAVSLGRGSGWNYMDGPWVLPPNGVSQKSTDGITWTNDTSLNPTPSYTCGPNPAGVTGAQCIWLHLTTNEVCDSRSAPNVSTATTKWPCSWHPGWTKGILRLQVDDYVSRLNNGGYDGKQEKLRILAMTPDASGGYYTMLQRHATCDNPTGDMNGTPPALLYFRAVDGQTTFENGWQLYVGGPGQCDQRVAWIDSSLPLNQTTVPMFINMHMEHGGQGVGPDGVQITETGEGYYRTGPSDTVHGMSAHKTQEVNNVPWNGVLNGDATGVMEIYSSISNSKAPTPLARSLSFDARHMNPGSGGVPEVNNFYLYNHTLTKVSGTSFVYKTNYQDSGIGLGADHKLWRPVTQSSVGLWRDISAPAPAPVDSITDNTQWASCFAYKAGECRHDSAANDYYVWAKNMYTDAIDRDGKNMPRCWTGALKVSSPCTVPPWPQSGWIVQNSTQQDDLAGVHFRRMTMGLVGPFSGYHYSAPHPTPDHKFMFVRYSWPNGISTMPLLYQLPPPPVEDSVDRSHPVPVEVDLPYGSGYARVRFGYAENGGPGGFYCTSRQEPCLTDAKLPAFAYEQSDSLTATDCRAGCSIKIPALSGRALYYRVERSATGTTGWMSGATQVKAVQ